MRLGGAAIHSLPLSGRVLAGSEGLAGRIGAGRNPAHSGKNELAGLEQSVVCGETIPPWIWAIATTELVNKNAATRERILRSI